MSEEESQEKDREEMALIETGKAIPAMSVMTSVEKFNAIIGFGKQMLQTGFLPSTIRTPAQAVAIILTGQELGIPPMQSLRNINVIKGKPTLSAELMLALFIRKGGKYQWIETTDEKAVLKLKHPNNEYWHTEEYSINDAKRAGLVKEGSGWLKNPKPMNKARVISSGIRAVAPDIGMGTYIPEEMEFENLPTEKTEADVIEDLSKSVEQPQSKTASESNKPQPPKSAGEDPTRPHYLLQSFHTLKDLCEKHLGNTDFYYEFLKSINETYEHSNKIPNDYRKEIGGKLQSAILKEIKNRLLIKVQEFEEQSDIAECKKFLTTNFKTGTAENLNIDELREYIKFLNGE